MAKAEWTKYFALSDDGVFWGLEQYKSKLPQSPEEEALLRKAGIISMSIHHWIASTSVKLSIRLFCR